MIARFFLISLVLNVSVAAQEDRIPAPALPVKTIAILHDQPSPYFKQMIDGFLPELNKLARDQYQLKVVNFNAVQPTLESTRNALARILADPNIDAVFTAGVASSHSAYRLTPEQRTKPIMAGAMEFADVRDSLVTPDGTSKVANYSFVLIPERIYNDLLTLSRLAKARTIDVLIQKDIAAALAGELPAAISRFEKQHRINLRVHLVSPGGPIPPMPSARAVYVPLLPSFTQKQRVQVFEDLIRRKLPHLTIMGPLDVEQGAFASLSPNISDNLHRRLAVNLHQMLSGIDAQQLPAVLRLADQLTINLATAQKIGWSPDYDTSLTATFINEEKVIKSAGKLTLEGAMARAAKINPDVKVARARWQASVANTAVSRAAYSTTASLTGQIGASGTHDRINRLTTPANAQSASLGFEVNRLLYSDRLYQAIIAQTQLEASAKLDAESITLDTIESTAHAYLDALSAEALYRIQRENVLLVQENLGLAKVRRDIGARDDSDYLRWLASLASARSSLIRADADRLNTRTRLNVLLASKNRQTHFKLTDISLGDQDIYFLDNSLMRLVENDAEYQVFIRFIKDLACANAPELKAFDYNLRAQGILLNERSRRHLRPEIRLTATARRLFSDSTLSPSDSQNEWTVGIGFTMPFLETQLRAAETAQIRASIAQLFAQREKARYLVEQRALAAGYNMGASHPAMRYARKALAAAEKNYQLVKKRYSLGQADTVTLLDAQSNWLNQRQAAATSTYAYLKDLISMQRSVAWYEYSKSEAESRSFIRRFQDYKKTGHIHVHIQQK